MRSGQHAKFLDEYDRLGADLKQQRTIMYFRVMAANLVAARNTDREGIALGVYSKAVADYRRAHPTATNLELLLLDFHFLKRDYKKVVEVVDQLDQRVGGDPYLNLLRGNAHVAIKEMRLAKACLRSVEKACPWVKEAYHSLVEISLEEKDYTETTRVLIAKEKNTGEEWDLNFNGAEVFAGYRDSEEFVKWKAYKLAQ